MKYLNFKKKARLLAIVLSVLLVGGCGNQGVKKEKIRYKYTIWIGSEIIATGNKTNSFEVGDDFISFLSARGKTITVPKNRLISIVEN